MKIVSGLDVNYVGALNKAENSVYSTEASTIQYKGETEITIRDRLVGFGLADDGAITGDIVFINPVAMKPLRHLTREGWWFIARDMPRTILAVWND
jgi:hypothetical protein